jgi:hypothetical protein
MRSRVFHIGLLMLVLGLGCSDSSTNPQAGSVVPLRFDNFQPADVVIGHLDMTSGDANAGGSIGKVGFDAPTGVSSGSFYVADASNNRVLGYAAFPTANGTAADFVMGQADFTSNISGTTSQRFRSPVDCVVSGGKLFVVDYFNSRVLIWNSLPTSAVPADVVVGQPDFTTAGNATTQSGLSGPVGLTVAGGKLFVAERLNRRVLIWNTIPTTNGQPADVVVGNLDFTSSDTGPTASLTGTVLSVWSDGKRLAVADAYNYRVLIWNSIPTTNGAPANVVVGAPDFVTEGIGSGTKGFANPDGLASDGFSLFVADSGENRVMIFTPSPTANDRAPSRVLGQSDFLHAASNDDNQDGVADTAPSARTMFGPAGIRVFGRRLLVADQSNNRILVFNSK